MINLHATSRKFFLLVIATVMYLLKAVNAQIGVDLCACTPSSYTFRIRLDLTCPGNIQASEGIESTSCTLNNDSDDGNRDFVPNVISSVTIAELNSFFQPIKVTTIEDTFTNLREFDYTSITAEENDLTENNIVSFFQSIVRGRNADGDDISNVWVIQLTNACGVFPIFSVGDAIGWLEITDFNFPRNRYCPGNPTPEPSSIPTFSTAPSVSPSALPTSSPSASPTGVPSASPSGAPSTTPSVFPTVMPSSSPSFVPTGVPTGRPSGLPTSTPSEIPTVVPTLAPTVSPSTIPTSVPSEIPTTSFNPTPSLPTTEEPSVIPSGGPTNSPLLETVEPTESPTETPETTAPTDEPTTFCPPATIKPTDIQKKDPKYGKKSDNSEYGKKSENSKYGKKSGSPKHETKSDSEKYGKKSHSPNAKKDSKFGGKKHYEKKEKHSEDRGTKLIDRNTSGRERALGSPTRPNPSEKYSKKPTTPVPSLCPSPKLIVSRQPKGKQPPSMEKVSKKLKLMEKISKDSKSGGKKAIPPGKGHTQSDDSSKKKNKAPSVSKESKSGSPSTKPSYKVPSYKPTEKPNNREISQGRSHQKPMSNNSSQSMKVMKTKQDE